MAKPKGRKARPELAGSCCGEDCCASESGCCGLPAAGCCQVEAVVGVDGRGQMVLPKPVREMVGLKAGDKLAVISWVQGGEVCCLSLVPASGLQEAVRTTYGPLLRDMGVAGSRRRRATRG